jgi:hypothetical protein
MRVKGIRRTGEECAEGDSTGLARFSAESDNIRSKKAGRIS